MLFKLTTESVQYQTRDTFIRDFEGLVEDIYEFMEDNRVNNNAIIAKFGSSISDLVWERFRLSVKVSFGLGDYYPAAIVPFSSDYMLRVGTEGMSQDFDPKRLATFGMSKATIKSIKEITKAREEDYKRVNKKKGSINFKHARVGGYLSEVRHFLILNFITLKVQLGLTPLETVSVIMHEIGHAFNGLVTHYKFTTTNHAISEVNGLLNNNRVDKAYYVYKSHFGPEELREAALSEDSDRVDFYPILARRYLKSLDTQFMDGKYDETSFEYMADNFATKFGLGEPLATGLSKIHAKYGNRGIYNGALGIGIYYLVEILLIGILLLSAGSIGVFVLAAVLMFSFSFSGVNSSHLTYDKTKDRYNRIRQAIIANLKVPGLPKEYTLDLIKQFEVVDAIINNSIFFDGIMETLSNTLLPGNRNSMYYIETQKEIEQSLNNVLFVKSAKLKYS